MKKIDFVFLLVILLEIILTVISYFLPRNECGSGCGPTGLFRTIFLLLIGGNMICPAVCVSMLNPLFYFVIDFLALTVVVYVVYLVIRWAKKRKK